jgi:hypothetical protein
MALAIAESPAPFRIPVRVVEPVPPPPTESVPEMVGAKVNAPEEFVILSPVVMPFVV